MQFWGTAVIQFPDEEALNTVLWLIFNVNRKNVNGDNWQFFSNVDKDMCNNIIAYLCSCNVQ